MSQNVIEAGHRFHNGPHLVETRGEEVVATFETHAEAARAMEALADAGFPVEKAAVVARGIQLVEQVTGLVTSWRAALKGAVIGAAAGVTIGAGLATFGALDFSFGLALWGLLLATVAGAVVGWALHIAEHEGPFLESATAFRASAFDLVVTENAGEAARIVDAAQQPGDMAPTPRRTS